MADLTCSLCEHIRFALGDDRGHPRRSCEADIPDRKERIGGHAVTIFVAYVRERSLMDVYNYTAIAKNDYQRPGFRRMHRAAANAEARQGVPWRR
jgi:hypothetical protein